MIASVGEPFVLSTYTLSKQKSGRKNVYIASCSPSSREEAYVVSTVQGEGIHVLDIATLHPVVSVTLGPTTSFACPAVVHIVGQQCSIFAAIQSSPDISADEAGRTVWSWTHEISSGSETGTKRSVTFPTRVSTLYAPSDISGHVLVISESGDTTLVNELLNTVSSLALNSSSAIAQHLFKSFHFSRPEWKFVGSHLAPTEGVILTLVFRVGKSINIRVISVNDGSVAEVGQVRTPELSEDIIDVSLSSSGFLSILTSSGTWHMFQFESTHLGLSLNQLSKSLTLANLSLLPGTSSVLASSSSHTLLAGTTTSASPELVLLLWDLQYSVVLSSYTIPLPSSLCSASQASHPQVTFVSATATQVALALSPNSSTPSKGTRSTVYIVPVSVPKTSTIANAIGRSSTAKPWIKNEDTSLSDTSSASSVLAGMRSAIERNRPEAADNVFLNRPQKVELEQAFVKEVMNIVLQPSKPAGIPYSSKVLRQLLESRVVTADMVEPSLLKTLELRQDWSSVLLALRTVRDIPELDMVALLHAVVVADRQAPLVDIDSMQVDVPTAPSSTSIPSLIEFLAPCVSYTCSAPTLRIAFRQHLREAEDVLSVLSVLDDWLERWHGRNMPLIGDPSQAKQDPAGIVHTSQVVDIDLPSLSQILSFTQSLMDASFITLLQHLPAHRVLRRLSRHLEPELLAVEALETLRAPLEPFVRAQTRLLREAADAARGVRKEETKQNDWRRRRKAAHERAEVTIGLYQVEELAL